LHKKLLFILLIIFISSCNNTEDKTPIKTYIAGQIVNPKNDFVVLTKDNMVIDTLKLDENNFFKYETDCDEIALYTVHHNENQMFFVEPGDSLILRVNTIDFDESLSFTGRGAEKNNLLMDFFLINEREASQIPLYNLLSPIEFEKKIDSLKAIKTSLYNDFIENNDASSDFKYIASANINYNHYLTKEKYISSNAENLEDIEPKQIPKEFYSHRDKINLGDKKLGTYYPYYRFLNQYLDNLAYQKYKAKSEYNRQSYLHDFNKLKLIDSLVTNDSLKNSLLKTNMKWYLISAKDATEEKNMLDLFLKVNKNKQHQKEMNKLAEATINLVQGNKIPNVLLVNTDNVVKDLHSIISKPTVLYFWSLESVKHYRTIHTKAAELRSKFPEYDFVGINTDTHYKKWLNVVKQSNYNRDREYQFENINDAETKLVINSVSKAIILNKKGEILESNSNLHNTNIENLLVLYLNK
jgi:fructose-specific component phosphotransferase system IIB-like protein